MIIKQGALVYAGLFLYSVEAVAMNHQETYPTERSLGRDIQKVIQRQASGPVLLELYTEQGLARFATWNHNDKAVSADIARIISVQGNALAQACLYQAYWDKDPFLKYVFRSRSINNHPFLVVIINRKGMYLADHFLQNR